jgi:hypothetical protein
MRTCMACKYDRASRSRCESCGRKTGVAGRLRCGDCRYGTDPVLLPLSNVHLAWLAGVIEGEGTFGRSGRSAGQVRVVMCDQDIIHRMHVITGIGRVHYRGQRSERCRPQWEWSVTRRGNVLDLDELLAPLLLSRRRETVRAKLAAGPRDLPPSDPPEPGTPEAWAWVAGLIEGEGWIGPSPASSSVRPRPVVGVESTDEDVIERLAAFAGTGMITQLDRKPGRWKPTSRWSTRRRSDVRRVLTAVLPHLGERRTARTRYVLAQIGA